jgi:hypothetical protein
MNAKRLWAMLKDDPRPLILAIGVVMFIVATALMILGGNL